MGIKWHCPENSAIERSSFLAPIATLRTYLSDLTYTLYVRIIYTYINERIFKNFRDAAYQWE